MYSVVHVSHDCMFFWAYFEVQDGELCLCTFPETVQESMQEVPGLHRKKAERRRRAQSNTPQRYAHFLQARDVCHLALVHAGPSELFPLLQALSSRDVNIPRKAHSRVIVSDFPRII